ncbi:U-box domain containing protein [Trichomonas vaginalis G3]|uniref:U-box domain containing protein n=1 Tax=Trichomonas vaginalis (strain ATCC PRA-98 / G3) TaxID=412133 RepID=A2ED21_TRIV3|nr:ubiquitin-ubiquitin ligase protein [Trichomonas vaginalis G3]EAY09472.1 U-box domain containing protein [Trichomonas vaginalis G3]KAI5523232.1 ubiquitin-ubiquitin ligase protein [Trichomonas vaginalis G3]|eukprot:XP_001321695.1 U-box domain containing protein [Trichomonas vaginalis G3]
MSLEPELLEFVRKMPALDTELLTNTIASTVSSDFSQDEFIFNIMSSIDKNKVSSFQILILLSSIQSESNVCKLIKEAADNYIKCMIDIPTVFQEDFTISLIAEHFVKYVVSKLVNWNWVEKFIKLVLARNENNEFESENRLKLFILSITIFSDRTMKGDVTYAATNINFINYFLGFNDIRIAFANSQYFEPVIKQLLSQSIFPHDRLDRCTEIFSDPNGNLTKEIIKLANSTFFNYHTQLFDLFKSLLAPSTRKQIVSLMGKLVESLSILNKDGIMFNNSVKAMYLEAIGYHLEYTLIRLALFTEKQVNNIDPHYIYNSNAVLQIDEDVNLLAPTGENNKWYDPRSDFGRSYYKDIHDSDPINYQGRLDAEEYAKELDQCQNKDITLVSHFFFLAWRCISFVSCSFCRMIPNLSRNINRSRRTPGQDFEIKQLTLAVSCLEAHILMEDKLINFIDFFNCSFIFLKNQANYQEPKLPEKVPLDYKFLPDYILGGLVNVMNLIIMLEPPQNLSTSLCNLSAIFSNYDYINSLFIKSDIVEIFATISKDHEKCFLVSGLPHIAEQMIPSLAKFFSDVQNTGSHSEYYDRFNFRNTAQDLLRYWFQFNEFKNYFAQHCDEQIYQDVVFHLVDDTILHLGDMQRLLEEYAIKDPDPRDSRDTSEIETEKSILRTTIQTTDKALKLIEKITSFLPHIFSVERVIKKLTSLTLSTLNFLIYKNINFFSQRIIGFGFHYNDFFEAIATTLSHCISDEYICAFVNNEAFYSNDLVQKTLDYIQKIGSSTLKADFSKFARLVFAKKEELERIDIPWEDIPGEFNDQLTEDLMENPVKLPDDTIVDQLTFENLLRTSGKCPLSQAPLGENDAIPLPELKQKIQDFKKQWFEQHKK